jgi:TctA family transporter
MLSVTTMVGDITAILVGVPGEVTAAALVLDGHPLAKKGEAGRALGAALMSSLVGAVIGGAALLALIPVVTPIVLAFGSPEFLLLTILGLTFVGSLGGGTPLRGLIAGAAGLLLATVGLDPQTGIQRYTYGMLNLWDGVGLVPVAVGLFAIPEMLDLAIKGTSISTTRTAVGGVTDGVRDTFRHWRLTAVSSVIGTFIGLIPGLGGPVAQFVVYGQAAQTAKDPSRFGKGAIEGVLAPSAAMNSKEAGNILTAVAFGVPSTVTMAILLGAFLIHGIAPGPAMLTRNLDVTMSLIAVLIVAHIIMAAFCFAFLKQIAKLTFVRAGLLMPLLITFVFIGAFAERNSLFDVLITLGFGLLGVGMVRFGWPRPPLVLGLVLGGLAENYLFISTSRYGFDWLTRPIVIVLIALTFASITFAVLRNRRPPLANEHSELKRT